MKKGRYVFFTLLLVSLVVVSVNLYGGELTSNALDFESQDSKLSSQNFMFNYTSTYKEEIFHAFYSGLEFGVFNRLTFFFTVSGDQSTNAGLSVSFIVNTTRIDFSIHKFFQNNLENNLTETFSYPSNFSGSLNITIICTGRANYGDTGTLVLSNQIAITPISLPVINKDSIRLPCYPEWLWFQGSLFSPSNDSLCSRFYCLNDTQKLNLTISFATDYFASISQTIGVKINDHPISSESFEKGEENQKNFILPLSIGLNELQIIFTVEFCPKDIRIYNIQMTAHSFLFEEYLTIGSLAWITCNSGYVEHIFNLSDLKNKSNLSEQILYITLNYRFVETKIVGKLNFELVSGIDTINSGTILADEQSHSIQTINIETFTLNYIDSLLLHINGTLENTGYFILLDTSKIQTRPILNFTEPSVKRVLSEEEIVSVSIWKPKILSYYDVFKTSIDDSSILSFSFSFQIPSLYGSSINSVTIKIYLGENLILYQTLFSDYVFNETRNIEVHEEYNEIRVDIILSGSAQNIIIQNILYQLELYIENPLLQITATGLFNIDWILVLVGWLVLRLIKQTIYRLKKRSEKRTDENYGEYIEIEEPIGNKRLFLIFLLRFLVMSIVFLSLFYSLFWFFQEKFWFFLSISLIYGFSIGSFVELIDFNQRNMDKFKEKIVNFISSFNSLWEFCKKIFNWFTSSGALIRRTLLTFFIINSIWVSLLSLVSIARNLKLITIDESFRVILFADIWKGYYLLFTVVILAIFVLYWQTKIALHLIFVEDNLKRTNVVGGAFFILFFVFWIPLVLTVFFNLGSIKVLSTLSFPILMGVNHKLSNDIGKIHAEENNTFFSQFKRNGKLYSKKGELDLALSSGIHSRKEFFEKKDELEKELVISHIIYKLEPGLEAHLHSIAENTDIPRSKTHELLKDISKKVPKLGKYYPENQVYVKTAHSKIKQKTILSVLPSEEILRIKEDSAIEKIVEQLLLGLREKLRSMFGEDNFIDSSPYSLEQIVENEETLTKIFKVKSNFEQLSEYCLSIIEDLSDLEIDAYVRVLLVLAGAQIIEDGSKYGEPFLKAWVKIHASQDKLRKNWGGRDIQEVLVEKLSSKAAMTNGFDDMRLGKVRAANPKLGTKYILEIFEQKTNNQYDIFRYVREGAKRTAVGNRLVEELDIKFYKIMTSLLASGKYTYEAALEIIEELSRKYRCKTSAIGLGFLIKSITKEFRNTIKLALGDQKEAERVIKSALEQNQLISLIQHGFALQRVDNDEGLSKCKNRLVSQIALRKFVDHLNRYFEIKIPGDVFFPSFIKKSDGKICLQITGFDTLLDAFNPNSEEYRVYEELNSLIRRALMDAKIREVCIDRLNPEEIVGKLNKMHFAIYHKLLKEGKFEFSEVFIDGSIDFYLETLNSYGDITKNYIKNKLKSHVVVPFTDHQHWHIPIEGFRDIFKAKDAELREEYERFRKKYYGKTVKKQKWHIKDVKEALKEIKKNPELGQKLIRDAQRPFAIPAGNWLLGGGKKGLCFFDSKSMKPIYVIGSGNTGKTIAGKILNMNDFYSSKASRSSYLLQCPINFYPSGGRNRVVFGSIRDNNEASEAWTKHLKGLGIPDSSIDMLKRGFNFNVKINLAERMKLLFIIWCEYRKAWTDFSDWIGHKFSKLSFQSAMESPEDCRFSYDSKSRQWIFNDKIAFLGFITLQSGRDQFRQDWRKFANLFPSNNQLFNYYIDDFEQEFTKIILKLSNKKGEIDKVDYLIKNWQNL